MNPLRVPDETDAQLEGEISRNVREKGKDYWVKIIVRDGYVNLCGMVNRKEDKREIEVIAQTTPGTRLVTNHLRIKPWEEKRTITHF